VEACDNAGFTTGRAGIPHQVQRRLNPLCLVQHQQSLKTSWQQHIRIQRQIKPLLIPPDHDQGKRPAIQPSHPDRVGKFLLHGMFCLQLLQRFQIAFRHISAQPVPCPRHILARHVDDPFHDPVLSVRGRQQFRLPRQLAPPERPGRKKRRVFPEEGRRVRVSVKSRKQSRQIALRTGRDGSFRSVFTPIPFPFS
jgi:hypothetical protein